GLASQFDPFDQAGGRPVVETAAMQSFAGTRVDEGPEADVRDAAGASRGNVAEELADDSLWKVVALDRSREGEFSQFGRQSPMSADGPLEKSQVRQMIEPAPATISLAGPVNQRQIARRALTQE